MMNDLDSMHLWYKEDTASLQKLPLSAAASPIITDLSVEELRTEAFIKGKPYTVRHGDVLIASLKEEKKDPSRSSDKIEAVLFAKRAYEEGLRVKPWVQAVVSSEWLKDVGEYPGEDLAPYLMDLGFKGHPVLPLPTPLEQAILQDSTQVAVLSTTEGEIFSSLPLSYHSYVASPLLVIAYALVGSLRVNLLEEPLGYNYDGKKVYLRDLRA